MKELQRRDSGNAEPKSFNSAEKTEKFVIKATKKVNNKKNNQKRNIKFKILIILSLKFFFIKKGINNINIGINQLPHNILNFKNSNILS